MWVYDYIQLLNGFSCKEVNWEVTVVVLQLWKAQSHWRVNEKGLHVLWHGQGYTFWETNGKAAGREGTWIQTGPIRPMGHGWLKRGSSPIPGLSVSFFSSPQVLQFPSLYLQFSLPPFSPHLASMLPLNLITKSSSARGLFLKWSWAQLSEVGSSEHMAEGDWCLRHFFVFCFSCQLIKVVEYIKNLYLHFSRKTLWKG